MATDFEPTHRNGLGAPGAQGAPRGPVGAHGAPWAPRAPRMIILIILALSEACPQCTAQVLDLLLQLGLLRNSSFREELSVPDPAAMMKLVTNFL